MSEHAISAAELIALEEKQLFMFLTDVRPVGEEKSELYPEPQYFNASFMAGAVSLPYTLQKVLQRCGSAGSYGKRAQRVLSPATALHMSGIAFMVMWGREMLLLEDEAVGRIPGTLFNNGKVKFTDAEAAAALRFSYDVTRAYRQDGLAYPSDTGALGENYRIISAAEAETIAAKTTTVDATAAKDVLGLMAAVRALSFLMEAETREGLMVHGPYPVGNEGHKLIVFECSDLHWSLFPNFRLPGNVRWALPHRAFPTANIAIALVLRNVDVQADRFGTLYINPLGPENVVSASLLTRGEDAYKDDGLTELDVSDAKSLRRLCEDIQEFMFMQIASWDLRQRMAAGVMQEQTLLLRILSGAGYVRSEIEREQMALFDLNDQVLSKYFEPILATPSDKLPFFRQVGEFAARSRVTMFSPFFGADGI